MTCADSAIVQVSEGSPLLANFGLFRPGYYLMLSKGRRRLRRPIGPFPSAVAAKIVGTSACSLGLLVPE